MNASALQSCTTMELAVELLEDGTAEVIPALKEHEPFQIEELLAEATRRLGIALNSSDEALAAISESPHLPEDQRVHLAHAMRVRRAKQKFFASKSP